MSRTFCFLWPPIYLFYQDLTTRRVLENAGAMDKALAVDAGNADAST